MADTPKIKLMSNLNLNDNSFIIKDTTRITFPDNPIEGIECLVNGINYIYTILDGFLSWIPTSINRETKNFTIEPAEQNWVISHNWNTDISKLDIICYNSDNKVITGNIAQIDKNSFSVAFSSAVAGRITLFNSVGVGSGLTPEDKTKIDGIEEQATKNETDAFLLDRSNHTGSIPISVVENLEQELANISTGGSGGEVDLTNPSITGSITEQVYNLTGTEINPTNGTIQYKTVSANTVFTETLTAGQSVVLRLIGANGKTITFPTITWIGVTAPTLTANCVIVLWKEQSTLYGAYVGSLV